MAYLQIDTELKIPKGNFAFIQDKTGDEDLFKKFYEAEKILKVNYVDFAHKIRVAYEKFALHEETSKRMQRPEYAENLYVKYRKKL